MVKNIAQNRPYRFLNAYRSDDGSPILKIETKKAGYRTHWKAKVSIATMERTKRYLDRVWSFEHE